MDVPTQLALIGVAVVLWIAARHIGRRIPWLNQPRPKRDASFLFQPREAPVQRPMQPAVAPTQSTGWGVGWGATVAPQVQTVRLSTLAHSDNILVVGQKGAGKTTLLRKIIAARSTEELLALDPHAQPGKWPCVVIGAGRDYAAIGNALTQIERDMDTRFKQLARGEILEGQFPRRSVVTDEYRSIADKLNGKGATVDAGSLLLNRISEGRKVGECALVACHNDTTEALGISGNSDMKTCFDWIVYMGGLVDSQRTQKCPPEIKAEARKRERPAVAWLTEKNQWFVVEDDLPMPIVSAISPLSSNSSLEPVPVNVPVPVSSEHGNQFLEQAEPVPGTDSIDADMIKALHLAGWSNNQIADKMRGRREARLARIRDALSSETIE